MMTFCLLHSNPDPAFQPIAKANVLYVYIIPSFVLAVLAKSPKLIHIVYALQA